MLDDHDIFEGENSALDRMDQRAAWIRGEEVLLNYLDRFFYGAVCTKPSLRIISEYLIFAAGFIDSDIRAIQTSKAGQDTNPTLAAAIKT